MTNDFTEEDIKILEMLSSQVAIAIYMAQQKDKLIEKEKEASIGYVTRDSVHWIGNKIGPIKHRVESIAYILDKMYLSDNIEKGKYDQLYSDLKLIRKGAESALSIKADLIDPVRKKVKFDVLAVLRSCILEFKNENDTTRFTYNFQTKSFTLYFDRSHIERVFHYILKNAVQAIEDKIFLLKTGINIEFTKKVHIKVYKDKMHLIIEVEDNGCGIPEKDISKLFRPFFTTKGADRGSGVGLYFCKRSMEKLGGRICLKKTMESEGTVFSLEFPLNPGKLERG